MNQRLRMHRDSAVLMLLSAGVCVLSGRQEDMKIHRTAAALLCLGGVVCLTTGFRMTHPGKAAGTGKPIPTGDGGPKEDDVNPGTVIES